MDRVDRGTRGLFPVADSQRHDGPSSKTPGEPCCAEDATGLSGGTPHVAKTLNPREPFSGAPSLPNFVYSGARTTLRGSRSGLLVSPCYGLILGPGRGPCPSRKADRRRRPGLAGAYRAPISGRSSLSVEPRAPVSPGTSRARHACPLPACSQHRTSLLLGCCSLGGLA
jgi:hypothetical protein